MNRLPDSSGKLFEDLPAGLVKEVIDSTEKISKDLMVAFQTIQKNRELWRDNLKQENLLQNESELEYVPIPTTAGIDGSYAVERLLSTDLVAAAAVAVEGITPPSETRFWPEPRHMIKIESEQHDDNTNMIVRALMIGMEQELAINAPHEIIFIDGSLTTPLIYFNQALNKIKSLGNLKTTKTLIKKISSFLEAYHTVLSSKRSDRCWVGIPKYTTRREIGEFLDWPNHQDDRGLLSNLLKPGEFIKPKPIKKPEEPWHLNTKYLPSHSHPDIEKINSKIIGIMNDIYISYYRPHPWLPAIRFEVNQTAVQTQARLAKIIHGLKHQCGSASIMEPYPIYMADRMVKHLSRALPTFRQITSQRMSEDYGGDISDVFLGLHGYRTESGR